MRLLLATVGTALLWSSAASTEPPRARGLPSLTPPECPSISRFDASRQKGKLTPRKLGELPPADAYLAVVRQAGKCHVPEIVKYDVGGR